MSERDDLDLSSLLDGARQGDEQALGELARVVHGEVRAMAASLLRRERVGHTLQPTALVNEAWVRLLGSAEGGSWTNHRTLFKGMITAMRRVLVDHARARQCAKRGGAWERMSLTVVVDGLAGEPLRAADLLDLHAALEVLAEVNERAALVVELRIFGGLTIEETAELLETSKGTVDTDFKAARAWLRQRLEDGADEGDTGGGGHGG